MLPLILSMLVSFLHSIAATSSRLRSVLDWVDLPDLFLAIFDTELELHASSLALSLSSRNCQPMLIHCRLFKFSRCGEALTISQSIAFRQSKLDEDRIHDLSLSSRVTLSFNSSVVCSEDKNFRSGWNQLATRIPP